MNVAQETLGFRRAGLSPALSLLMSAFALPIAPEHLSRLLHSLTERSSTAVSTPSTTLPARSPQWRRAGHSPVDAPCKSAPPILHNVFEGVLTTRSFGYRLEPRYIFRAGRLDQ